MPYLQFFLSNHAILQVNAISDAEKVMKHFDNYRTKFSSLFSPPPLKKLNNPGYYRVPSSALGTPVQDVDLKSAVLQMFDDIATAQRPRAEYTNSDWGTIGFFFLLGMLPTALGDRARIAMMRLPV